MQNSSSIFLAVADSIASDSDSNVVVASDRDTDRPEVK